MSKFFNLKVSVEKPLFLREVLNRTYTVSAYYWGKTSSEMPFHIIYPILQVLIIYFLVGLNLEPVSRFFCLSNSFMNWWDLIIIIKSKQIKIYSRNWRSLLFHRSLLWIIAFSNFSESRISHGHGSNAYYSIYVVWRIFREPKQRPLLFLSVFVSFNVQIRFSSSCPGF